MYGLVTCRWVYDCAFSFLSTLVQELFLIDIKSDVVDYVDVQILGIGLLNFFCRLFQMLLVSCHNTDTIV